MIKRIKLNHRPIRNIGKAIHQLNYVPIDEIKITTLDLIQAHRSLETDHEAPIEHLEDLTDRLYQSTQKIEEYLLDLKLELSLVQDSLKHEDHEEMRNCKDLELELTNT